jgi:pyrrolysine biosynthesis protein PylC
MAEHGPLQLEADFFGADEALTSHGPGKADWVATLMVKGSDLDEAWERRGRAIHGIRNRFGLTGYSDESPEERNGKAR